MKMRPTWRDARVRTALVAFIGGLVLAVVVTATLGLVSTAPVEAVSATAVQTVGAGESSQSFDVTSVKPNNQGELAIRIDTQPGGRFIAQNVPVRTLIRIAYGLEDFQIVGAESWVNQDRFDVVAKAARDLPPMSGPFQGPPELQPMLRFLLAERFGLVARMETRELPVLALTRSRREETLGPGLRRSAVDCEELTAKHKPDDEPLRCGVRLSPGTLVIEGASIEQLAAALTALMGRKVVDRTGVRGNFDLQLSWTPMRPGADSGQGRALVTALQEEAGFTLESTSGPQRVLVIESIHKPSEN